MLNPIITGTIDIMCLAFLLYFRWYKSTWSVPNKRDKTRSIVIGVLASVSIITFAVTAFLPWVPFAADILRPFIIIEFLGSLRQNLTDFLSDLWSSLVILLTIFGWIFIFAIVGFYMFRYSFEGTTYFNSLQ